VLAADSAFDVVEQAMPQCEVETEQYRAFRTCGS
jgi:hypothetical protein